MARKVTDTVQLKLRFSEALRRQLEKAATKSGQSMNGEIISRLEHSFTAPKLATEVAFGVTQAHLARDQEFASRLERIEEEMRAIRVEIRQILALAYIRREGEDK